MAVLLSAVAAITAPLPAVAAPAAPEVTAAIQARLAELGYYRGQTDGIVGQMTREAIRRYERRVGLEPTGEPSLDLYRRLRESAAADTPAGPAAPAGDSADPGAASAALPLDPPAVDPPAGEAPLPPGRPDRADAARPGNAAEAVGVSGASWRFADEGGAVFTVGLKPDGRVGGVPFGDSWAWEQKGDSIELRYANRLGRTVTRRGTLVTADSIAGTATSSAGGRWAWTAERLP